MAKILVTGSLGFIGRHLTQALRAHGHDVYGCDLAHGVEPVAEVYQYERCDISIYEQIRRMMFKEWDYVYNLAAEFGRANGEAFYEQLWSTNVIGLKHLLALQQTCGFRLVHFSSSEVYGDYPAVMTEDVMDRYEIKQLNDYALSKWVNEIQIRNWAMKYGTESVIVRPFNVYGPGEIPTPYRSAMVRFIYAAVMQQPMVVYRGHQRSWLYIDDLVRTLATIPEHFKPGEVYNLGHPESLTMEALADLICERTGASRTLIHREGPEPQTTRMKHIDVTKAIADLGHQTTVGVTQGIARTTAWMRQVYA